MSKAHAISALFCNPVVVFLVGGAAGALLCWRASHHSSSPVGGNVLGMATGQKSPNDNDSGPQEIEPNGLAWLRFGPGVLRATKLVVVEDGNNNQFEVREPREVGRIVEVLSSTVDEMSWNHPAVADSRALAPYPAFLFYSSDEATNENKLLYFPMWARLFRNDDDLRKASNVYHSIVEK